MPPREQLDADVIAYHAADGGAKLRAELLFAALLAVRAGRVVELSAFGQLALNPGPVRTPWAIDNVVPKLLATFAC